MNTNAAQQLNALQAAGTPYRNLSIGVTGAVVSNVAANIVFLYAGNTHATAVAYLKLYNKATAPTASDVPVYTFELPAADTVVLPFVHALGGFTAGIGIRATLNAADNDTTAPTGAVVVNIGHSPVA